jgi:glycosyltransferase involved in cell wall biosynthesis
MYREAAHVIAVAGEVADNLAALDAADPADVTVIPNAVELSDAFERAAEVPEHPWFDRHESPLVVSVGRLVRKKDHGTLLEAFARLRRDRPARLVVLGEGPMRQRLETAVARLGLSEDVAFPGHATNPFSPVARADLFVLSSISEGMPSALIEALACGTPVVSTDCPSGPREILGEGRFGELVAVGDVGALAAAMARQLDAPRDREALRARARLRARPGSGALCRVARGSRWRQGGLTALIAPARQKGS